MDKSMMSISSNSDNEEIGLLLSKASTVNTTYSSRDAGLDLVSATELDTKSLFWIMIGIWIGTFCAGLGEQIIANSAT